MRILLTNIILAFRTGTECVIRDLAIGFSRRGHVVNVYAPIIGETAQELIGCGIAVTDDLDTISDPPDVIHGHHNVPTVEAIARFPDRPAVWVCHDFVSWFDTAPRFPQIRRYFAVDETCRERLISRDGISSEMASILHNAVDLNRIPPRRTPLQAKPKTALAFTKTTGEIPLLETVCGQSGISLNRLGLGGGRISSHPEADLVKHDVVFATARGAIEAIASGAAVIVGDERGFAGLATTSNYDRLRSMNFGLGCLSTPMTEDGLHKALSEYDPADASRLSERLRRDADLTLTLQRLESVYDQIIEEQRAAGAPSPADTWRALRAFMHVWLPKLGDQNLSSLSGRSEMLTRIAWLNQDIMRLQGSKMMRLGRLLRRIPFIRRLP